MNTSFDRIYFYGKDRPVHVSFSESPSRQVTILNISSSGRQIPKTVSVDQFVCLQV
jgi:hypothetical protein